MRKPLARQLIESHLLQGKMDPGEEIALTIDQTLTQDATGTMVMLELEAMGLDRVRTACSVQYVDHNLLQQAHRNADDHLFLRSACARFGLWYSGPGNGVSHPVHQECFGRPGATLLGSDSHTPSAGAIGMLAIGAGGLEVALAMAGEPFYVKMPKIWGIRLTGKLPDWVSAKDVILTLLLRHGVKGGVGHILEYSGPGLAGLSTMDRHVIANMGTELGATSTVFPSDREVLRFLRALGRESAWTELAAEEGAEYDRHEEIDLSRLEPLIAMPSSPGAVRTVRETAGEAIGQAYLGSSANPGYRDFAMAAEMVKGRQVDPRVSFDVNPASRQVQGSLVRDGHYLSLLSAGARIHQAGCNGCIGMGQAPATGKLSLRTVPRNFPGRSGTRGDRVCLVSPETVVASALTGVVTDPRTLSMPYPRIQEPERVEIYRNLLVAPLPPEEAARVKLEKGPNISTLPAFDPLPEQLAIPVLLRVGDDLSTDDIMPAGSRVLPFRSNIPKMSDFAFDGIDPTYPERARAVLAQGGHALLAGENYGQGSSREHAALVLRFLGLRLVVAKSFARIHWQNLVNFGVLPLTWKDPGAAGRLQPGVVLALERVGAQLAAGNDFTLADTATGEKLAARHALSSRQVEIVRAGGLLAWVRNRGRG